MKKLSLLFVIIMSIVTLHAQVVLTEDFSGGVMPPAGWTIDAHGGNWTIRSSANSGGVSPEAGMSWSPQFNGATRLISPVIDLTDESTVLLQFRHMIDHYSGNYQIGVATRKDGGDWTNAWTRTITTSVAGEQVAVAISDANVNSATFQFCIFFNGSSYNINDWYIDDVQLLIPANRDAALTSIDVPTYFTGSKQVKGKITNLGLTPVTSFKYEWQVGDGAIHSNYVVGQNITLGQVYSFTATDQVSLEAGIYDLNVWVSDVNGITGSDDIPGNDTATKILRIPTQTVDRKPLFEEFTSSTCAPCASFNSSVFNPFIATNGEQLVLVKYQMNWPGSGDPYYTLDGGQRRTYYGVNAVPMLFTDGKNTATSSTAVNTAFNNSLQNPAFVNIAGYYTISGMDVSIDANVTAYTDIDDATLQVVVFEGVTTGNIASNGETEFHHVMMRCLPDGNGSPAIMGSGIPMPVSHVVDMTGTNVEEMDDLQVAIFLQDNVTKEIFQAAYATLSGALVNITPANNATEVLIDEPLIINFSEAVQMPGGQPITNDNVASLITFEMSGAKGTPVPFTATIDNNAMQIVITPDAALQMSTAYDLTVAAVENLNGLATYEASSHFTTQTNVNVLKPENNSVSLYPNPAHNLINVTFEGGIASDINIFNSVGAKVETASISTLRGRLIIVVENMQPGMYFMRFVSQGQVFTTRFVVAG